MDVKQLRKILGNSKLHGRPFQFVDRIREDLAGWGLLKYKYTQQRTEDGEIRNKAQAKLLDEVLEQGWKQWEPNVKLPNPVPDAESESVDDKPLPGVYAKLKTSLGLLRLDYEGAKAFALQALQNRMKIRSKTKGWKQDKNRHMTLKIYSCWLTTLDALQDAIQKPKRFKVHPEMETRGRAYTIMTSLPTYLRKFVTLNGEPLVVADISCSQPLLFGLYLKQNYPVLTPDMAHYLRLVQSGEFYPYLKDLLVHYQQELDLDTFKAEFFGKVFYSKEKKFHPWRCLFHMYFPGVSQVILDLKGAVPYKTPGDPKKMTCMLSLLESDLMLQGVAAKLYKAKIKAFITVHDAIYTTAQHYQTVIDTIQEEYAQYGITPNIKG